MGYETQAVTLSFHSRCCQSQEGARPGSKYYMFAGVIGVVPRRVWVPDYDYTIRPTQSPRPISMLSITPPLDFHPQTIEPALRERLPTPLIKSACLNQHGGLIRQEGLSSVPRIPRACFRLDLLASSTGRFFVTNIYGLNKKLSAIVGHEPEIWLSSSIRIFWLMRKKKRILYVV